MSSVEYTHKEPSVIFIIAFICTWIAMVFEFGAFGALVGFVPAYGAGICFNVIDEMFS